MTKSGAWSLASTMQIGPGNAGPIFILVTGGPITLGMGLNVGAAF